jgi:hypothetical protein
MNKEQTHKEINRLIRIYEKRVSTCSDQWDELNESNEYDPDHQAIIGESMNGLIAEMDLMQEFISDLETLIKP